MFRLETFGTSLVQIISRDAVSHLSPGSASRAQSCNGSPFQLSSLSNVFSNFARGRVQVYPLPDLSLIRNSFFFFIASGRGLNMHINEYDIQLHALWRYITIFVIIANGKYYITVIRALRIAEAVIIPAEKCVYHRSNFVGWPPNEATSLFINAHSKMV